MSKKVGTIAKFESLVLLLLAVAMIPSFLIALFNKEITCAYAFSLVILIASAVGIITRLRFKLSRYNLKNRDGFLIVSISALIAIFAGALPFFITGYIPSFTDSLFESCSGFTTTNATLITDINAFPKSLIFWRAFMQWLGALGILVLLTAIAPAFGMDTQTIAELDTTTPTRNKLTSHFSSYSKQIYIIYIVLTFVEVILLKVAGLTIFDSFVHTFGTISTGGFSTYSLGILDNIFVSFITIIFMVIAALNINLYFISKKRGIKEAIKDEETHFFFVLTAIVGCLLAVYNCIMSGFDKIIETLLSSIYQVISIITTTGIVVCDYNLWPTFSKFVIFALLFIGGCSSSASGGIKCLRIYGGGKLIIRGIYSRLHPNIISPVTLNHMEMSNETAIRIANFIFTYVSLIVLGTLLLSFEGYDFTTNFSTAISCMSNVGPVFNGQGPLTIYQDLNGFSKAICALLMLTGRLEIYPILVLLSRNYWNPNKIR